MNKKIKEIKKYIHDTFFKQCKKLNKKPIKLVVFIISFSIAVLMLLIVSIILYIFYLISVVFNPILLFIIVFISLVTTGIYICTDEDYIKIKINEE